MQPDCHAEIVELHRFFEHWFRGELTDDDDTYARFGDALDPHFEMVSPDGRLSARDDILAAVRDRHGAWSRTRGTHRIWIENVRSRQISADVTIATYEEWQDLGGEVRGRRSTVVFRHDETASHGVCWLHVHETWIP